MKLEAYIEKLHEAETDRARLIRMATAAKGDLPLVTYGARQAMEAVHKAIAALTKDIERYQKFIAVATRAAVEAEAQRSGKAERS